MDCNCLRYNHLISHPRFLSLPDSSCFWCGTFNIFVCLICKPPCTSMILFPSFRASLSISLCWIWSHLHTVRDGGWWRVGVARGDDITDCGAAACPFPACEGDPTTNNNRNSQSELWYALWRKPEAEAGREEVRCGLICDRRSKWRKDDVMERT